MYKTLGGRFHYKYKFPTLFHTEKIFNDDYQYKYTENYNNYIRHVTRGCIKKYKHLNNFKKCEYL